MVQLQEAVTASRKFLLDVFQGDIPFGTGITLEGVELTDDMNFWLVTFSYWTGSVKNYKTVKLRSQDGVAFGIKNADL
jgi:hypothetical protein